MGLINPSGADLTRCAQLGLFSPSAHWLFAIADGTCKTERGFSSCALPWYVLHLTDAMPGSLLLQNTSFNEVTAPLWSSTGFVWSFVFFSPLRANSHQDTPCSSFIINFCSPLPGCTALHHLLTAALCLAKRLIPQEPEQQSTIAGPAPMAPGQLSLLCSLGLIS